jgi:hypothetical protein
MKKIFTLPVLAFVAAILFTAGCVKDRVGGFNENYWLSQERGDVVYSDSYCSYIAVETNYGYTIIRATGSSRPYEGDVVYGNFAVTGYHDYYNRTDGRVFSGQAVEADIDYVDAQYAIDYYCPYGRGTTNMIKKSENALNKTERPVQ